MLFLLVFGGVISFVSLGSNEFPETYKYHKTFHVHSFMPDSFSMTSHFGEAVLFRLAGPSEKARPWFDRKKA
jgi:hypothetical protein